MPLRQNLLVSILMVLFCTASTMVIRASVVGSKHDFSSEGWSRGEICLPCHTPHNANPAIDFAPLWNHEVTTASYTVYSSSTMDVTVNQPGAQSKACLSCHDGTVAVDSFGGSAGTTFISGDGNLTTDLSDDHPVGIDWEHQTLTTGPCGGCHQPHDPTWEGPLPFFEARVECPTCHDVHNTAGLDSMVRLPMTGSALCMTCHQK